MLQVGCHIRSYWCKHNGALRYSSHKHGQVPANSPEKISNYKLHMHLGISKKSMHANNSDTELAQIKMLWQSSLPIWMFMYEMFILVLRFTYLSFGAGARDCSRCSPLSRGSAPPLVQERKCVEDSSVLSPSRAIFLSLVRGYSDVSCIALSLPRYGLTQILAWAALCAWDGIPRERERGPERSHTHGKLFTFMMTYWGILSGNTVFFFSTRTHTAFSTPYEVFLWRPCSYM